MDNTVNEIVHATRSKSKSYVIPGRAGGPRGGRKDGTVRALSPPQGGATALRRGAAGSFEELAATPGFFQDLVRRQVA